MNIKFSYTGKTALVVGGSRGIGKQIVLDFLMAGANVYYISRNESTDLLKKGANHLKCNLESETEIKACFQKLISIDFLINVAAINFCKPISKIDSKEWDKVLNVNLRSFYLTSKLAVEKMSQNNFGRIVNISSIAGRNKSVVSGIHYTSSKAGIIGLSRQLAHEVGKFGINVNVVCPSQTLTDMLKESMTNLELCNLAKSIPIKRIATTVEQSLPVLFLCSDAANYITGAVIDVNGGQI